MACFADISQQTLTEATFEDDSGLGKGQNSNASGKAATNNIVSMPYQQSSMDELQSPLLGGGAQCKIVRTCPEMLAFRCLFYKCYITNLPDATIKTV
eukprot:CAMPEP_0184487454 /NCGR_PEP_ID=MMETSP0113_2-20130426/10113_1 /TAXON_ID=91329 /ORGANISM="Norrisiella sphaerica, Strain BC52" /LENGTH=96 /DNA_ID=CAMNT_0026869779 /DNA_START=97 /DNA_END=388 /DNA_ORIENTATION=+